MFRQQNATRKIRNHELKLTLQTSDVVMKVSNQILTEFNVFASRVNKTC